MANPLLSENIWFDKYRVEDAERAYYEKQSGVVSAVDNQVISRIEKVEQENKELKKVTNDLQALVKKLEQRISALEKGGAAPAAPSAAKTPAAKEEEDDEDDFELFGSDDEDADEEAEKLKQERLAAYAAKKAKKPALIAKSNIILDVKPWDDETDMKKLEECVRSIEMDGLLWGTSKLVPVGYGIKKLQITCVVEDDKVGTDDLEDKIVAFEDYIQSMDIVAFNKI